MYMDLHSIFARERRCGLSSWFSTVSNQVDWLAQNIIGQFIFCTCRKVFFRALLNGTIRPEK